MPEDFDGNRLGDQGLLGLATDRRGNLYVSSSTGPPVGPGTFADGGIWRVPPRGTAELWVRDWELAGTGDAAPGPFPIGAKGIAHHGGSLFVANTEKRQVVEVPIRPDGGPGAVRVAATIEGPTAENSFAGVLDGLAVDAYGNLYPLLIGESRLVRVYPDGQDVETVADLLGQTPEPKVVQVHVGVPGPEGR